MVTIHQERVNHLKVIWTYHDDRIVDSIIFVDDSELPIKRTVITPNGVRYSLSFSPIQFANYLYQAFFLKKQILKTPLKIK